MMKKIKFRLSKIILMLLFLNGYSMSAQDSLELHSIEKKIDEYLTYFSNENPGMVLSYAIKGEVVFEKAYGLVNVEKRQVMDVNKLFNIGELSKSFTAIAVLKLAEKNKLSLDDHLKNIFPDFPEYGKEVTVNDLLNHKSGLASYDSDKINSNDGVYQFLKGQNATVFEPGSKFQYSNSDYALLVTVIERKSGMTYQNFLKKYVFKKLSMNNTFFYEEVDIENLARAHTKKDSKYIVKDVNRDYVLGEQGIYTTSKDFIKYDNALYTNKLLRCEYMAKIFTISKLESEENKYDYSCGWVLMAKKGVRYSWQGTSRGGYSNIVLHLPDTQKTILMLANRDDGFNFLRMAIYIAKLFDKDLKL